MIIKLTREECLEDEILNNDTIKSYHKSDPYTDVVDIFTIIDSKMSADDLILSYAVNASTSWKKRDKKATEKNLLLLLNVAMTKYLLNNNKSKTEYKKLQTEDLREAILQHADNAIIAMFKNDKASARMFVKGLIDHTNFLLIREPEE